MNTTHQRTLTPAGTGAIATIEVAGPKAWPIVQSLFHPANGRPLPVAPPLHRVWFGRLGEGDEVVVTVQQVEPDAVVAIHSHGGRQVVRWLVSLLEQNAVAVRPPMEETAWTLLEKAPTLRTAGILLDQCHGAFTATVQNSANIARLAALAPVGRHLIAPWKIVIAGAPNVGKSSLVNAMAGYQRSVTSPTAGTTRDVVTTFAALDGWPVELADTAGLRATAETLEAKGIELARQCVTEADLVVWLLDGTEGQPVWPGEEDGDAARRMVVINKADQPTAVPLPPDLLRVSATTGEGLAALIAAIVLRLVPSVPQPGEAVPYTPALADLILAANVDPANAAPLLTRCLSS